ncbi:hypothetical protein SEPCBS119000_006163 [Sporothrix epigloea]|uniref:Uncharacterized protein n=1 Tax=Sporothrix epigloea TaxID=1892477 RepID=A0ABP0E5L8_9PEZI
MTAVWCVGEGRRQAGALGNAVEGVEGVDDDDDDDGDGGTANAETALRVALPQPLAVNLSMGWKRVLGTTSSVYGSR